jgi:hypothetical protein
MTPQAESTGGPVAALRRQATYVHAADTGNDIRGRRDRRAARSRRNYRARCTAAGTTGSNGMLRSRCCHRPLPLMPTAVRASNAKPARWPRVSRLRRPDPCWTEASVLPGGLIRHGFKVARCNLWLSAGSRQMHHALDLPPTPGDIVRARSRRYLVEEITPPPNPGDQTLVRASKTMPKAKSWRCSGRRRWTRSGSTRPTGRSSRPASSTTRGSSAPGTTRCAGAPSLPPTRSSSSRRSRRHPHRRLPARTAAQGAAAASRESLHRRRCGAWEDYRGRPHRPRAVDARARPPDRRRRAAVGDAAVERGAGRSGSG